MPITNRYIKADYDFKNENDLWLICKSKTVSPKNYERTISLSGERWCGIQKRCLENGSQQLNYPRYVGSTNLFEDFQDFVNWSREQVGYTMRETVGDKSWAYCVDKDILGFSSKIYSRDTCLFVPNRVNVFLTSRQASRGQYPIGVSWKTKNKKFQAQVVDENKHIYLGLHSDPMEGHRAWQKAKIALGRELANKFEGWHNKLYVGLNNWLDVLQSDYDAYRETVFK